jgi:hypothetical protein
MTRYKELVLPDQYDDIDEATEVVRAFITSGETLVSLQPGKFRGKMDMWGGLIADIVNHIVNAEEQLNEGDRTTIFRKIESGYRARMTEAFKMSGRFLGSDN